MLKLFAKPTIAGKGKTDNPPALAQALAAPLTLQSLQMVTRLEGKGKEGTK